MSKKKKIIVFITLGIAIMFFVLAFLLGSNKKFVVSFDSDGGSYVSSQEVKNGSTATKPIDPSKVGYNFVEWQLNGKKYDFSSKVSEDIKLKAVWEKEKVSYEVKLEVDGVSKTIKVKDGDKVDLTTLKLEEKVGFEIKWYLNDKEFDIEKNKITENTNLVGKYVEVKTYSVTFDTDGGSAIEAQIVNENRTVKKPKDPEKEGFVLEGWYLDNKKYNFTEKVTSDITLKAKWKEDTNITKYTVTFNSDGGSNVDKQTVFEGKKATAPKNPTKNGYDFVEWQLDGKKYDFNTVVTKNITLKALWTEVVNYTVTFNTSGGTTYQNQTVRSGSKASNPGSPTRSGYVFEGWDFDFNTPITKDITINAKWRELRDFTVRFDSDGGSSISSQTVKEGNKASNPTNPTRSGYVFDGWYLGNNKFDFNTPITSDITLKAHWKQTQYYLVLTRVDDYSPDYDISVKEGSPTGNNVSFKAIKINGTMIYAKTINGNIVSGLTSVIVVLTDNSEVTATVVK